MHACEGSCTVRGGFKRAGEFIELQLLDGVCCWQLCRCPRPCLVLIIEAKAFHSSRNTSDEGCLCNQDSKDHEEERKPSPEGATGTN